MAGNGKKVQWRNAVQNHQNGQPLPVLDPKVAGYEATELYQWEICIQLHLREASMKVPTVDIGDKIKNVVIKLHEMHGKNKFSIFTEAGKVIELGTFPKKAPEIKAFLDYKVRIFFKCIAHPTCDESHLIS
eukprot:2182091-Ditylum_brightwellii.AAC.1